MGRVVEGIGQGGIPQSREIRLEGCRALGSGLVPRKILAGTRRHLPPPCPTGKIPIREAIRGLVETRHVHIDAVGHQGRIFSEDYRLIKVTVEILLSDPRRVKRRQVRRGNSLCTMKGSRCEGWRRTSNQRYQNNEKKCKDTSDFF